MSPHSHKKKRTLNFRKVRGTSKVGSRLAATYQAEVLSYQALVLSTQALVLPHPYPALVLPHPGVTLQIERRGIIIVSKIR